MALRVLLAWGKYWRARQDLSIIEFGVRKREMYAQSYP